MITILLATHNGGNYLRPLLESVSRQTCTDWRIAASDDGSTDDTLQILREWELAMPGRIRILDKAAPLGSAAANFMYLLTHTDSDYYMFCDQDDVWLPNKIETTFAEMKKLEGDGTVPVLVHTDLKVVDKDLGLMSESFFGYQKLADVREMPGLLIQNCVTGCTAMINRALRDIAVRGSDASRMVMHDHWLALCAAAFGRIGFISEATILYRQHGDNSLGAQSAGDMLRLYGRLRSGRAKYLASLERQMEQAAYFAEIMEPYGLQEEQDRLVRGFAELKTAGHWERIAFFRKYRIRKTGAARRIMQFLWS